MALVHYPVLNRKGEIIASAITNLDLHDLARTVRTFEIPACYIVTPLKDQQVLAARLLSHWCEGVGRELHPDRAEALGCLRVVDSIASAKSDIEAEWGRPPKIWATSAREQLGALAHKQAEMLLMQDQTPYLLLFGTGWGLAPFVLNEADAVLEAIRGVNGYNHLSVRCAAAILMDRILRGRAEEAGA